MPIINSNSPRTFDGESVAVLRNLLDEDTFLLVRNSLGFAMDLVVQISDYGTQ